MVLYRRGNGKNWHTEIVRNGERYRKSTGTTDKALAQCVEDEFLKEIMEDRLGLKSVPTVQWMHEKWLKGHQHFTAKHLETTRSQFRLHILPRMGNKLLTAVDNELMTELRTEFAATHAPETTKALIRHVTTMMHYAIELGYIQKMPYRIEKVVVPERSRPIVHVDEMGVLIGAIRSALAESSPQRRTGLTHVLCMVQMALYCGMRSGEIRFAEWQHLDLKRGTYTIPGTDAKANTTRVVFFPDCLVEDLKLLVRTESPYLFPSDHKRLKGEPRSKLFLYQVIRGYHGKNGKWYPGVLEKAGLPPMGTHRLRASFATNSSLTGTAPIDLMKTGGWKNLKTLEIYLEPNVQLHRSNVNRLVSAQNPPQSEE